MNSTPIDALERVLTKLGTVCTRPCPNALLAKAPDKDVEISVFFNAKGNIESIAVME